MAPMTTPSADLSVRTGWGDDAPAIAAVQVAAWRVEYADLLPAELLDSMDPGPMADAWRQSISRPSDARHRVLVALERNAVRGFALTSPASDPDLDPVADGEIAELTIHPDHTRLGHGSRLVHAAVDTLRADKFQRAVVWLNSTDDIRRGFLTAAGWEPDGAHRELDLDGDGTVRVKQVRLHTDLSQG
jgi:ribosomal protein S18 acetylase RimI-like enzyme